jgi:hypothetical protein
MRNGDIYVHADIGGSSSCIVRCKLSKENKPLPISPFSLQQAGQMSVCRSNAWSSKMITSAWWVNDTQVSKKSPTGEYLGTGSFMIYGKKNFLPPVSLEMGFGILFRLDDNCVVKHANDRKDKQLFDDNQSMMSDIMDRYDLDMNINEKQAPIDNNNQFIPSVIIESFTKTTTQSQKLHHQQPKQQQQQMKELKKNSKLQKELKSEPIISSTQTHNNNNYNNNNDKKPKKKQLSKKKARKYADQDDEDRELAMVALGHTSKKGIKMTDIIAKEKEEVNKINYKNKKDKSGINYLKKDWTSQLLLLFPQVQDIIKNFIKDGIIKENEIDCYEIETLASFSIDHAIVILDLFKNHEDLGNISNKSGFLSGIMRRLRKDMESRSIQEKEIELDYIDNSNQIDEQVLLEEETTEDGVELEVNEIELNEKEIDLAIIKEDKQEGEYISKEDQDEINLILEEEGIFNEDEGIISDEINKITDSPLDDDVLLYAVPMCGPYTSFTNFKYKCKLTPGIYLSIYLSMYVCNADITIYVCIYVYIYLCIYVTGTIKKGKMCKQAVDVFSRYLSIYLSMYMSIYLTIYVSIYLSLYL